MSTTKKTVADDEEGQQQQQRRDMYALYESLVRGQYERLGVLRGHFFKLIKFPSSPKTAFKHRPSNAGNEAASSAASTGLDNREASKNKQ